MKAKKVMAVSRGQYSSCRARKCLRPGDTKRVKIKVQGSEEESLKIMFLI